MTIQLHEGMLAGFSSFAEASQFFFKRNLEQIFARIKEHRGKHLELGAFIAAGEKLYKEALPFNFENMMTEHMAIRRHPFPGEILFIEIYRDNPDLREGEEHFRGEVYLNHYKIVVQVQGTKELSPEWKKRILMDFGLPPECGVGEGIVTQMTKFEYL